MNLQQAQFTKGCFLFLAFGTIPVLFMNIAGYLAGLGFIALLSIAFSKIIY